MCSQHRFYSTYEELKLEYANSKISKSGRFYSTYEELKLPRHQYSRL